jgi:hypothetical protein
MRDDRTSRREHIGETSSALLRVEEGSLYPAHTLTEGVRRVLQWA